MEITLVPDLKNRLRDCLRDLKAEQLEKTSYISTLSVFLDISSDPIEFPLRVKDQRRSIFAKTA